MFATWLTDWISMTNTFFWILPIVCLGRNRKGKTSHGLVIWAQEPKGLAGGGVAHQIRAKCSKNSGKTAKNSNKKREQYRTKKQKKLSNEYIAEPLQTEQKFFKLMTHWPVSGACVRCRFLALETGASRLVPETMTYFAIKWYQHTQKKNGLRFWEFWGWWRYSRCFSIEDIKKIQKKKQLRRK